MATDPCNNKGQKKVRRRWRLWNALFILFVFNARDQIKWITKDVGWPRSNNNTTSDRCRYFSNYLIAHFIGIGSCKNNKHDTHLIFFDCLNIWVVCWSWWCPFVYPFHCFDLTSHWLSEFHWRLSGKNCSFLLLLARWLCLYRRGLGINTVIMTPSLKIVEMNDAKILVAYYS